MLRLIWAYGIQLWGCAKPSQTQTIQAFQSITLRLITSASWYVSNYLLHKASILQPSTKLPTIPAYLLPFKEAKISQTMPFVD